MVDSNIEKESSPILNLLMSTQHYQYKGVSVIQLLSLSSKPLPSRLGEAGPGSQRNILLLCKLTSFSALPMGTLRQDRKTGEGRRDLLIFLLGCDTIIPALSLHHAPSEDPAAAAGWW